MLFERDGFAAELTGVFCVERNASRFVSLNHRNYDSISIRIKGNGEFIQQNKTIETGRNDILYISKKVQYIQQTKGEIIYAIHFINFSYSTDLIEKISVSNFEEIEKIVKLMYDEWDKKKIGYKYRCMEMFYHIMYLVSQQRYNESLSNAFQDNKIKKSVDYIHNNFRNENISVKYLASLTSYSEVYYRELFIKIFKVPPKRFILNLRLEYAAQLLKSQFYSVQETSYKAGFESPKYFGKVFREKYGMTPNEYKKSI